MEKSVIGLVAAIGAAAPFAGAQAAVVSHEDAARALHVTSIAELLEPVANSGAILAALAAAGETPAPATEKNVQVAQYYYHHHHHHYHHHYYHHHHHHYYYHHHHHRCFYSPLGYVCP